jgi:hypothetical protein
MTKSYFTEASSQRVMRLAFLALILATTAQAQKTTRASVSLTPCSNAPARILFVLNGQQVKTLDKTADSWLVDVPGPGFIIQDACASLRLGGARTDCRRADPGFDPEHRYGPLALFAFKCDGQDAWQLTVNTVPARPVSYVRRIADNEMLSDPHECPCLEDASFVGKDTLQDLRFPAERLSLHLGAKSSKDGALGLNINAIGLKKTSKEEEYEFGSDRIAGLLSIQRVRSDSSAPSLSPLAIDIDVAKLEKMPLTKLILTVK